MLTNSGQPGSLVVLDVQSGQARRVLDGHPSTQFQQGLVMTVAGKPLKRPDGQTAQFSADGIAIDGRGEYVYWQATTGTTMFRAPVAALFDATLTKEQVGATVEVHTRTFIADGYWMSRSGAFYVTSCADNTVKQMMPDKSFRVVAKDTRFNWPDSMAEGPDGSIYVTSSHNPADEELAGAGSGAERAVPVPSRFKLPEIVGGTRIASHPTR